MLRSPMYKVKARHRSSDRNREICPIARKVTIEGCGLLYSNNVHVTYPEIESDSVNMPSLFGKR